MSLTFEEPRPEVVADPDEAERTRLQRRQWKRDAIARSQMAETRLVEIRQSIHRVNGRLDQLASDHAEAMQPLQDELQSIERRIIDSLSQRQPIDKTDESRRAELVSEVAEAGRQLERDLEAERRLLPKLDREAAVHSREAANMQAFTNDLGRKPLASPKLLAEMELARNRLNWAQRRHADAVEQVRDNARFVRQATELSKHRPNLGTYEERLRAWKLVEDEAGRELRAAQQAVEAAYQALLNE